jgi:beta-glucosidase
MAAFNDIGGVPTTANRDLLRVLLRERWGWQGLMVSDWGAIGELLNHGVAADRAAAATLALDASVDMDMVGGVFAEDLKEAVAKDPARLKQLDEAVLRILRVKETTRLRQAHAVPRCRTRSARWRPRTRSSSPLRGTVLLRTTAAAALDPKLRSLAVIGAWRRTAAVARGARGQGRRVVTWPASPPPPKTEGVDTPGAVRTTDLSGFAGGEAREIRGRHGAGDRRGL